MTALWSKIKNELFVILALLSFAPLFVKSVTTSTFSCPTGKFVTAINGNTGSIVDGIQFTCNDATISSYFGGHGGNSITNSCPGGFSSVIISSLTSFGTDTPCIGQITPICGSSTGNALGSTSNSPTTFTCPTGQIIDGVTVNIGSYIDTVQFICGFPEPSATPSTLPTSPTTLPTHMPTPPTAVPTLKPSFAPTSFPTIVTVGPQSTGMSGAIGTLDTNWLITSTPAGATNVHPYICTLSSGWNANTASVKWVAPSRDESLSWNLLDPQGAYTYQTAFTLPVTTYINVTIPVTYYADDYITQVVLNGVTLFSLGTGSGQFNLVSSYRNIFVLSINTHNNNYSPNPSGLQLQFGAPIYTTSSPSVIPSRLPTTLPSLLPSLIPTQLPTQLPTSFPSKMPSFAPTVSPTSIPSKIPSLVPTSPTAVPTTARPTIRPSSSPSRAPTLTPTSSPTKYPSLVPSSMPSATPSASPTILPTSYPSFIPSASPTFSPTIVPTSTPTISPSYLPSSRPTSLPSHNPTFTPTILPTSSPTVVPSSSPTCAVSLCQQGQYSMRSSNATCMPCPNGQFTSYLDQTSCSLCPVGTYNNMFSPGGTVSCALCPAGKYTSRIIGASACVSCPSGKYADSGAAICTPCSSGQYTPSSGYSGCLPCLPGTSSSSGASACESCSTRGSANTCVFNCTMY